MKCICYKKIRHNSDEKDYNILLKRNLAIILDIFGYYTDYTPKISSFRENKSWNAIYVPY